MPVNLFRFIWDHSRWRQLLLVALCLIGLPFYYLSLEIPKLIVNRALGGARPIENFVDAWLAKFADEPLLLLLCGAFIVVVSLHGATKFALNIYKSRVAEALLRQMRLALCARALRFPLAAGKTASGPELVTMVTAELDAVGGYASDALAIPVLQGGLMVTGLIFIFVQDPVMGIAAIALFPIQGLVTVLIQRRVNRLTSQRVRAVRGFAGAFARVISALAYVRAGGLGSRMLTQVDGRLAEIQRLRYAIVLRKSFVKMFNNFMFQLTPCLFFLLGGFMVLNGELTIGALVAVLAAYKDLPPPAKELLDYFQLQQDSQLKYEQILAQFSPPGLSGEEVLFDAYIRPDKSAGMAVEIEGLTIRDDNGRELVSGLDIAVQPGERVAILGLDGDAGGALARVLSGLRNADGGQARFDGRAIRRLPEPVLRAEVQLIERSPTFAQNTLAQDLWDAQRGEPDRQAITSAMRDLGLGPDLLRIGLTTQLPVAHARDVIAVRETFRRNSSDAARGIVEPFAAGEIARSASLCQNLVWAFPLAGAASYEQLADEPYLVKVLERVGIADSLCTSTEAVLMSAQHADAWAAVDERARLLAAEHSALDVSARKRPRAYAHKLLHYALSLSPDQLGLASDGEAGLLQARALFARRAPARLSRALAPFDRHRYYPDQSLQDNLIFGSLRPCEPAQRMQLNQELARLVEATPLFGVVQSAAFEAGDWRAACAADAVLEQRLNLARALLGAHRLVVVDRATSELGVEVARGLMRGCFAPEDGKTWLWIIKRRELAREFDRVIEVPDRYASR